MPGTSRSESHLAEPGLLVIGAAAVDDRTAFAFSRALASRWATVTAGLATRDPGLQTSRGCCRSGLLAWCRLLSACP
ncbi:DUF6207 family protein [Streptomyces pharetrae]|uniref:DUF6207 family protein n=1 Tax=Streptomyces pharetrae TaxID=291370 RepID=UPI003460FE1C